MELEQSIIVGSAEDADLRIADDPYVSPHHCRISRRGAVFYVEDLGSTNGTYLELPPNPVRASNRPARLQVLRPRAIPPGHRVIVGRTTLPWTT